MPERQKTKLEQLRDNKRSYKDSLDETHMPHAIIWIVITFIIGMSCYFSGYSKYVGGKLMEHIDVTILKMCYNNIKDKYKDDDHPFKRNHWEIYAKEINGKHSCNIKTGYNLPKKSDCTKLFSNRFAVGTNHSVYYNDANNTCMTFTQANTLSIIGFTFFLVTAISIILTCIYQKELNDFIIKDENKRNDIQLRIQEIDVEIQEENNRINSERQRIRQIVQNNNAVANGTAPRQTEMNGVVYQATPINPEDLEKIQN